MSINQAFSIAANGIQSASFRIQTHTQNVANSATPNYRRKIPLIYEDHSINFSSAIAQLKDGITPSSLIFEGNGVDAAGVAIDATPGKKIYEPGHPLADKDGFVMMSNVSVINELADGLVASKLYEANLAVISMVNQMSTKALDIGRGQ